MKLLISLILSSLTTSGMIIPSNADPEQDWATGVGALPCKQINDVSDAELISWVEGYWTGLNLYISGADRCEDRANLSAIPSSQVKKIVAENCEALGHNTIMIAAYNAMINLPTIPNSRSAGC